MIGRLLEAEVANNRLLQDFQMKSKKLDRLSYSKKQTHVDVSTSPSIEHIEMEQKLQSDLGNFFFF